MAVTSSVIRVAVTGGGGDALARARVRDHVAAAVAPYLGLLRLRILAMVLFTALPVLLLGDMPGAGRLGALLLATVLLGASCDAFNAYVERGSDALMERTRRRPLPSGRLAPARALAFAAACGAASILIFGALLPLAAAVASLVLAHYVLVYSIWLKPRTPLNIVIGGVAGGAAPLLADLSLRGSVGLTAWLLLAIVTAWTPPHFWAIALVRKDEYAAAGIPMLPVVAGESATRRAMLRWALVLVAVSLLPVAVGAAGAAYGIAATLLGAAFVRSILVAQRSATRDADRATFRASVRYLGLLVAAWAAEAIAARLLEVTT